ncbi:MAG TPA: hypothetical protein VMD91_01625 [Candidatus Sulfotelmatobacter sp.]|nr:hypothetical protein [Candidatus Sulfotelmatobacter sp.]
MSGRETDVDALFERDADARLLDRRRREELGLPSTPQPPSAASPRFGAESLAEDDDSPRLVRPAALRLALEARPDRELIPGALVTVVATLHDDGDREVSDATLRVTVPPEAEPVPGSFSRDEVQIDGEALLGIGLRLGTIPPNGAVRLRFALRILPGTAPLDVLATVWAEGVPAVAPPALRLRRRAGHAAYEQPRPFYELEEGEGLDLGETAPAPSVVDARSVAPAAPEPPPTPEPVLPPPPPEPVLPPSAALPVLYRRIDGDEVRALERVYTGALPHGLAALALLSSIAAADGAVGEALGLSTFARSVSAALPRALVAARMGRPTPPVVTEEALAVLRPAGAPPLTPSPAPESLGPHLVVALDAHGLEGLRGVLGRQLADPFLRGVQVLLAVAPRRIDGVGAPTVRFEDAVAAFRVAAGGWLMRVTVRRTVDRRFDPLTADDAGLHAAGRSVVEALREVIPT